MYHSNTLLIKSICLIIGFSLSTSLFSQHQLDSTKHLNLTLLNTLILKEVNRIRKKNRVAPLKNERALELAAQDHSNYLSKRKKLSHFQNNRAKKTPKNRADFYGEQFETVGENIQVFNLKQSVKVGKERKAKPIQTYERLALNLVKNWKNSKPHFKNMISPNHQTTYVAISIVNGNVYGCQLFGSSRYDHPPKHNRSLDYIYKPYKSRRCKKCDQWRFKGSIYVDSNRNIFFTSKKRDNFSIRLGLMHRWRDGIAADIVLKSQFSCNDTNRYNGKVGVQGISLPPVFKKDFRKNGNQFKLRSINIYLGKVPEWINEQYEVNLTTINNNRTCGTTLFHQLNATLHLNLDLSFPVDTFPIIREKHIINTFSEKVYYQKSKDNIPEHRVEEIAQLLKDHLDEITTININGYSSVEGSSETNKALYEKRVMHLTKILTNLGIDSSLIQTTSSENFQAFRNDVDTISSQETSTLSDQEIKKILEDPTITDSIESILSSHRYSELIFNTKSIEYASFNPDTINLQLRSAIKTKNRSYLLELQNILFQLIRNGEIDQDNLNTIEIPITQENRKALYNRAIMNYYLDSNRLNFYDRLTEIQKLKEKDRMVNTAIALYNFPYSLKGSPPNMEKYYNKVLRRTPNLITSYKSRMKIYFAFVHDLKMNNPFNGKTLRTGVIPDIKKAKLSIEETFDLASCYAYFHDYKQAYRMTKKHIDDTENLNHLVFFMKLIHLTNAQPPRKTYIRLFRKIKDYSGDNFCILFNSPDLNFQLLMDLAIKEIYCDQCQDFDFNMKPAIIEKKEP
ncbi:MAG: CAP domain-containing protein [Crocinitomicaceae bacterium]|nr:CAP domain-containing protein [Crocinitomicaceae bacterium]